MLRIVGTPATAVRGMPQAETGINVKRFQVRYSPEVDVRHGDSVGQTFLRSVSQQFSREISCEGEITGNAGIMIFTLGVAIAAPNGFHNVIGDFGNGAGNVFLDDAVVTYQRNGWASVVVRASSNPLL
jgi:hypothetical protein